MSVERHVIFGTAGHVDHGKSSLVLALTGTDPDRLAEEKAREMTIDLGFAFLPLPGLKHSAAIVDVPGHEMFVRNMVAGVTGIDAVIFVVAADEGVMPQTVEHLEVVRALGIVSGVIALTKSDKVPPERIAEVAEEVKALAKGTFLENARILPVSSVTREGLPALHEELARIAANVRARSAAGVFRLPIDRVFSLKGVGTVITGTVISGSLSVGENVVALPKGLDLRVRNLQVHNETVGQVFAGQRAAINLADASKEDLERGDVLASPGALAPSLMLDARLYLSSRAPRPLAQRTRVRIHHQTREVMARMVLLETESLPPGESALVQLRLESPLVAVAGDPFVMRSYSPMFVIGGGAIVGAHPPKRQKRAGADEVAKRETSALAETVAETLDKTGARGIRLDKLQVLCGVLESELREVLEQLQAQGHACAGRQDLWFGSGAVQEMQSAIVTCLAKLHAQEPLRPFAPLNAVAAGSSPSPETRECFRIALALLQEQKKVVASGEKVALAGHAPQWVGRYAQARDKILASLAQSGLSAPPPLEVAASAGLSPAEGKRVLEAMAEAGLIRRLPEDICILPRVFDQCRAKVVDYITKNGSMSIGQARELLGASRKYLLPLLETLDHEGVTVRQGDSRILRTR